nr:phosphoribosylaminoimidazole carboxylase, chloroplastic [Quercus suber]
MHVKIVSAHLTPEMMFSYASSALERGIQIIVAGVGGMVTALTPWPVIGVPMPRGVPVATVAINNATNAGLLAVRMMGIRDADLLARMSQYQEDTRNDCLEKIREAGKGWLGVLFESIST